MTDNVIEAYAREILRIRAEYEFHTYWLHVQVKGVNSLQEAESLRRDLVRSIAERLWNLMPALTSTPTDPQASFKLHYPDATLTPRISPLYVYGRYLKLSREIPQSKWPCRWCGGNGCERCDGTGKRYQRTVEEIAAAPLLKISGAVHTKMHSIGREDVDARMLGEGRPFVLELSNPRVRTFDLAPIAEALNRDFPDEIAVRQMQFANRKMREQICEMSPDKTYRADVVCLSPAPRAAVEKLGELRDLTLVQETPRRVLHRRPNKVRRRVLRHCAVELPPEPGPVRRFGIMLRVESGTYIKEFVSGDEGRAHPSVAQFLGVPCDCADLDVLAIHCDPLDEASGNGQLPNDK